MQREEDEPREEAIESFLDFDPNYSLLNLNIEDEESNDEAENHNSQEESIMMQRSNQTTTERGSTTFSSDQTPRLEEQMRRSDQTIEHRLRSSTRDDQNRLHVPPNRSTAQMPLEEQIPRSGQTVNRGSTTFSSDQNPRLEEQMRRSDQTLEHGLRSSTRDDQNRLPVPPNRSTAQMPLEEQIPRSDQTVNRGSTTFSSDQNRSLAPQNRHLAPHMSQVMTPPLGLRGSQSPFQNPWSDQRMVQNQSFGTQQQHFPMMMTTEPPGWFARDHSYASLSVPNAAAWRPWPNQPAYVPWRHPNMYQQQAMANQLTVPVETYVVQQHPSSDYRIRRPNQTWHFTPSAALRSSSGRPGTSRLIRDQQLVVLGPSLVQLDWHGQHFGFPIIDIIHQQTFLSSEAAPEMDHQEMEQPQDETESLCACEIIAGPSFHQGQDHQQQP